MPTAGEEDVMGTIASLLAEHVSFRCSSVDNIGVRVTYPACNTKAGW